VLSFSGASPGGVAVLVVVPEYDLVFTAFGNDPRALALHDQILLWLLRDHLHVEIPDLLMDTSAPRDLTPFAGTYRWNQLRVDVSVVDGQLEEKKLSMCRWSHDSKGACLDVSVGLLPDTSVNALPQQVGVAVMSGVLLDHVNQQLPQGDGIARAVSSYEAEVGLSCELLGERDLVTPCVPCIIDHRLISHGTVEVTVGLRLGLIASRCVLAGEPLPKPLAFNVRQVPYQTEQRHRRWLDRTASELSGIQAGTLELQS
jgi:hypothetical protein